MEFLKIINQELHYRKALERLCVQFPEIIGNGAYVWDIFRVEWFREADKPYVLILNKYEKGRVIRKEWYEYYKGNWNYIGFYHEKNVFCATDDRHGRKIMIMISPLLKSICVMYPLPKQIALRMNKLRRDFRKTTLRSTTLCV